MWPYLTQVGLLVSTDVLTLKMSFKYCLRRKSTHRWVEAWVIKDQLEKTSQRAKVDIMLLRGSGDQLNDSQRVEVEVEGKHR